MDGILDESTPVQPKHGGEYGESKAEAERLLLGYARDGLPVVILRPACVYGPFSRIFITRPMEALPQGGFYLLGEADGPSNMVYVDNLIESIVRSLEAPEEQCKGELFTISEPDQLSWREFYDYFAKALSYEIPTADASVERKKPPKGRALCLLTWPLSWFRGFKTIFTCAEFRGFGKRVLQTDPLGTFPRWVLQRYPGLKERILRLLNSGGMPIYRRPTPPVVEDKIQVAMGLSRFFVSSEKAHRVLGYTPIVSRQRAMELTLDWIRYAKLVSPRDDSGC
jgi:nucleoside-diphosphate-sugar epimerase